MARSPDFDPVAYLLRRRFPDARLLGIPPSLSTPQTISGRQDRLAKASAYEKELKSKTPDELQKLCDEERAKETADLLAKAEREEQQRFFNQPYANADFAHWSKAAHWTLDEAIALSFGKAPERVTWATVKPYVDVSAFAFQYQRRRDLAQRAKAWKQLFDPVLPGFFLAWAKRTDLSVPPGLEVAVTARGVQIADWKSNYDRLSQDYEKLTTTLGELTEQWADLSKTRDKHFDLLRTRITELQEQLASALAARPPPAHEKSLGVRERESLLKLVIGMVVRGYGHDPKASRSQQTAAIAGDLATCGVALDVDTVRKWLREAADLLPPQTEDD